MSREDIGSCWWLQIERNNSHASVTTVACARLFGQHRLKCPTSRQLLHRVRPANRARSGFGKFAVLRPRLVFSLFMTVLVLFQVARTSTASPFLHWFQSTHDDLNLGFKLRVTHTNCSMRPQVRWTNLVQFPSFAGRGHGRCSTKAPESGSTQDDVASGFWRQINLSVYRQVNTSLDRPVKANVVSFS